MAKLTEYSTGSKQQLIDDIYDLLVFEAFTPMSDAWKRDPDPEKVSWKPLERKLVGEALGYGSIEACQEACDRMRSQTMLLTVCGKVCVVKKEIIAKLATQLEALKNVLSR